MQMEMDVEMEMEREKLKDEPLCAGGMDKQSKRRCVEIVVDGGKFSLSLQVQGRRAGWLRGGTRDTNLAVTPGHPLDGGQAVGGSDE